MSTHSSDVDRFAADVERLNAWGKLERPLYVLIALSCLSFAAVGKANPEVKDVSQLVLVAGVGLIALTRGLSQLLLCWAIDRLFEHSELALVEEEDDNRQMWHERRNSAKRGSVVYVIAAVLIAFALVVEVWAALNQQPRLWFGALPASAGLLVLFARFQQLERAALPRQLQIASRLADRAVGQQKAK